jgi:hypothetical protein
MADMADKIHAAYPNAIIVLGFGNWDSGNWKNFDRAAAASDMVGIQGMRGSTKQNEAGMYNLYEGLLAGVKTLETKFPGKPIMLTDIAVSSYPDATYSSVQAGVLKEVLDNLPTLKAHGVEALIYRSWRDSKMDPANYYGEAESHWGLALADNTQKAAGKVWVDGVKAERSGASPAPTTTTTTSTAPQTTTTSTSAAPKSTTTTTTASGASAKVTPSGNEWWVQAGVATTKTVTKVEAKVGSNAYVALNKESYGWAKSIHATKGTMVQFRLTASDGSVATTPAQAWLVEMSAKTASFGTASSGTTTTAAKTTTTTAPATTTSATTTTAAPKPSSSTTTTTAAKTTTSTTSTTTAPPTSTTAPTTTTTTTAFKASFSPKSMADNTRVEVGVTANKPIAKVDAKVTIGTTVGSYVQLEQVSPGVYAKPMNAPDGAKVTIRATSTTGETYTSIGYTWG